MSFKKDKRPLVSVSLLISEDQPHPYQPPSPAGAPPVAPPQATMTNVKDAALRWADRLKSHPDNVAVLYFCGHGVSQGQRAALLLEDFGDPNAAFENAIDADLLRGTMKNSPAIQQLYLVDRCRTKADDLYQNESCRCSRAPGSMSGSSTRRIASA